MTSLSDLSTLIASLSSCAIEGNELAMRLLKLRKTDYKAFLIECIERGLLEATDAD